MIGSLGGLLWSSSSNRKLDIGYGHFLRRLEWYLETSLHKEYLPFRRSRTTRVQRDQRLRISSRSHRPGK